MTDTGSDQHGHLEEEGGEVKESQFSYEKEPNVQLDELETKEEPKLSTTVENDILWESYESVMSMSIWKKIHWSLAIVVTSVLIFVWRYVEEEPSDSFWWWIIPMFLFTISLTLHHHFESKKYEDGIVKSTILLNILLYLSNVLSMDTDEYVFFWWVYPAILSIMLVVPYYKYSTDIKSHKAMVSAIKAASPTAEIIPHEINWYRLAIFEYICISAALFLTWVNVKLGHPWFFYPIFVMASPLLYWKMRRSSEKRLWVLVLPQIILINLIVFVAWAFTTSKIPWFLPVLGVSCLVVAFLWVRWKREGDKLNKIRQLELNLSKDLSRSELETQNTESPKPEDIVIQ